MATPSAAPDPGLILKTLRAFQETQALKGAIELDIFTTIGSGAGTAADIAGRVKASERGVRILCDYLTLLGFLSKSSGQYALTSDSAMFLDKRSPAYLGTMADFLANEAISAQFSDVAAMVRNGGSVNSTVLDPEDSTWVEFARSMAPLMMLPSELTAQAIAKPGEPQKVLDIAAGHGLYGLAVARKNPAAQIYAADWANVLEVAKENAQKFGVADRFHTIPGSAFDVELGSGYDLILLPNFLHHFDVETNVKLLKKLKAAMKPGGLLATVEFVPNEDRISPPMAASFSLQMLGATPAGDAYTFRELNQMFQDAGFGASEARSLAPSPATLLLTRG